MARDNVRFLASLVRLVSIFIGFKEYDGASFLLTNLEVLQISCYGPYHDIWNFQREATQPKYNININKRKSPLECAYAAFFTK